MVIVFVLLRDKPFLCERCAFSLIVMCLFSFSDWPSRFQRPGVSLSNHNAKVLHFQDISKFLAVLGEKTRFSC